MFLRGAVMLQEETNSHLLAHLLQRFVLQMWGIRRHIVVSTEQAFSRVRKQSVAAPLRWCRLACNTPKLVSGFSRIMRHTSGHLSSPFIILKAPVSVQCCTNRPQSMKHPHLRLCADLVLMFWVMRSQVDRSQQRSRHMYDPITQVRCSLGYMRPNSYSGANENCTQGHICAIRHIVMCYITLWFCEHCSLYWTKIATHLHVTSENTVRTHWNHPVKPGVDSYSELSTVMRSARTHRDWFHLSVRLEWSNQKWSGLSQAHLEVVWTTFIW